MRECNRKFIHVENAKNKNVFENFKKMNKELDKQSNTIDWHYKKFVNKQRMIQTLNQIIKKQK